MNHHANKVDYSAGHDEPQAIDPVFSGVLQEKGQLCFVWDRPMGDALLALTRQPGEKRCDAWSLTW